MKPTTNIKAVIYARFSTDKQTDATIQDQIRVCTDRAKAEGMRVLKHYEDKVTGAAIGNRPGLLKLLDAAQRGEFQALLVLDLSRLSRSQADLAKMIDRLKVQGLRIIGVQDGFDSERKGHKLVSGLSGIMGEAFREMVSDKVYIALESRAKTKKPTGGRSYGYNNGREVNKEQAAVVYRIFKLYSQGYSCADIAAYLNKEGIASPGSAWKRTKRRANGWMNTAIRVILRNPLYIGEVIWNRSHWVRDPDTGVRRCTERPEAEWIRHKDEALRLIDQKLWDEVQRQIVAREGAEAGKQKASGGGARYLLSGLLVCGECGANFIIANAHDYQCSTYKGNKGTMCKTGVLLDRKELEVKILGPIQKELLDPQAVKEMAAEMGKYYRDRMNQRAALQDPSDELQALDAKLAGLKERLKHGDAVMSADDIAAVIDRVSGQRQRLLDADRPETRKEYAKVMALLPRAAELYRQQIARGLDGDPHAASLARTALREMTGGEIKIVRDVKGRVFAEYPLHRVALTGTRSSGSGGALQRNLRSLLARIQLN